MGRCAQFWDARARRDAQTSEDEHRGFLLKFMVIIHENINEYLAADLHGELSESEREELHTRS